MFRQQKIFDTIPSTPAIHQSLKSVLADYESIADSNPARLRECISTEDIWRFFVDGIRQGKGWAKFEKNEPGYFKAMYKAFQAIFEFSNNIDVNFIKQLHKLTTEDVKNTHYEIDYIHDRGEFRGEDHDRGGTYICEVNATPNGLYEALSNPSHPWLMLSIEFMDFIYRRRVIDIDKDSIIKLRQFSTELRDADTVACEKLQEIVSQFCDDEYLEYLDSEKLLVARLFSKLSQTINTQDIADCLYNLIQSREYLDEGYGFLLRSIPEVGKVRESLNAEMDNLIRIYYRSIPTDHDPIRKISAIISFVQACEQLHPFSDANCRVFCMLLLDHLLMRNGFPPAILDDPNRFDAYSREELLQEVIRGMRNTLLLATNRQLYQFDTISCIENLTEKKKQEAIKLYDELIQIEADNRTVTSKSKTIHA